MELGGILLLNVFKKNMSSARATNIAEGFSSRLLKEMYDVSLLDYIVNRDYEGEINGVGSKLNILNFDRIVEHDYVKGDTSAPDGLYENNTTLDITKKKKFYWAEYTIDNWLSYIKNPHSTIVTQKADERNANMDRYAFGFYTDVASGNRVGTSYTTGDVAVTATTGVVTGNGTTFTEAMVGRGFKADGHSKWYRVKQYNSATEIVIENDEDDVDSHYDGGAIAGGASYEIEAVTAVTITKSNLLDYVGKLKLKLDKAEANGNSAVPDTGRWLIVPPEFETICTTGATGITLHVPEVYNNLIQKGMITELLGFKIFKSNRLTGDNTDGYHVLAGHGNWLTFAEKLLSADIEEEIKGDFGTAYKDLFVYGGKVADKRRHFATEGFFKFSI